MPSDRFKSIKSARVAKTFKIKCQLEGDEEIDIEREEGRYVDGCVVERLPHSEIYYLTDKHLGANGLASID